MAFPLPSETFATCDGLMYCMMQYFNTVTNDAGATMLVIAFMFIGYLSTLRFGGLNALAFSGFLGLVSGIWFVSLQLIPTYIFIILVIFGVVSLAIKVNEDKK